MKQTPQQCMHKAHGACSACANPLSFNPRYVSRRPLRKTNPKHRWPK